jgi:subtilisin family serine protease
MSQNEKRVTRLVMRISNCPRKAAMRFFLWFGMILLLASSVPGGKVAADDKIGQGVAEALQMYGEANVVIALAQPPSMTAPQLVMSTLKMEIANLQDQVLSQLNPSDLMVTHKYEAVPGLSGKVTEAGLSKLVANPNVLKIDLDVGGSGHLGESVPLIRANVWHALGVRGDRIVVAVLDTGVDRNHADLANDIIHEECFLDFDGSIDGRGRCPNGSDRQSGPGAAQDGAGHGTATAGIITSEGSVSSVGVAPGAQIVAIKVLDNTRFAGTFMSVSEIIEALNFIINNRFDVNLINMSFGTNALFSGDCDNATAYNMMAATAINVLRFRRVIAFASSGNNGSGTQLTSPACLRNVVSVAAVYDQSFTSNTTGCTDTPAQQDMVTCYSNTNQTTDIAAPGSQILTTALGGGVTSVLHGTSFASPHAVGCAALLIGAGVAVTPDGIQGQLESSSIQVADPKNGVVLPRIDCGGTALGTTLTVNKVLVHPNQTRLRLFNLRIDGVTVRANVNGGSTGPQPVSPGNHTVDETGGTGTSLGEFETVIEGDCARDGTVSLALNQSRTCTITNFDNFGGCPNGRICCEPGSGTDGCLVCSNPTGGGCP